MNKVFFLLVVYQLKHFVADYPLQTQWMLGKFHVRAKDWVPALAAHAAVHGAFTFCIALWCVWDVAGPWSLCAPFFLATVDFGAHFIMDRIKASPKLLGRFKALSAREYFSITRPKWNPDDMSQEGRDRHNASKAHLLSSNKYFWWSLGVDQMVHHLTHYFIIWMLCL